MKFEVSTLLIVPNDLEKFSSRFIQWEKITEQILTPLLASISIDVDGNRVNNMRANKIYEREWDIK